MSNLKTTSQNANVKSTNLNTRTYNFSLEIIKFTSTFPEKRVYWVISDQLLRSSTSVGANITEAKSSASRKEFIKFYEIALKSANETKYWLNLLSDSRLITTEKVKFLIREAEEISKMTASSLLTLKGKRF